MTFKGIFNAKISILGDVRLRSLVDNRATLLQNRSGVMQEN